MADRATALTRAEPATRCSGPYSADRTDGPRAAVRAAALREEGAHALGLAADDDLDAACTARASPSLRGPARAFYDELREMLAVGAPAQVDDSKSSVRFDDTGVELN